MILGSGLGAFADAVEDPVEVSYAEIPGWPVSTAVGHAGALVVGRFGGVPVAVMKVVPISTKGIHRPPSSSACACSDGSAFGASC